MFNNPILDIAIGLVFIYLLYSLLATTIKEFIASLYSLRGRMLQRGIEQMLDGQNYGYYWWNRLYNLFAFLFLYAKIRRANQSQTDEGQKVSFHSFLSNQELSLNLSKDPRSRLDKKSELFASRVFSHPLYLAQIRDKPFNRKPAYLASDVFADIIVDLFTPPGPAPVLLKTISAGIRGDQSLSNHTRDILLLYAKQANGDLQLFRSLLRRWYNDTMDRVSGWYKKQASKILILIGFVLAITFNVSTIEIVDKLSSDKAAREALIKNASDYINSNAGKFNTSTQQINAPIKTPADPQVAGAAASGKKEANAIKVTQTVAGSADTAKKRIPAAPADPAYDKTITGLQKINQIYQQNISQQNTLLGLGWSYPNKTDTVWEKIKFVLKSCCSVRRLLGFLLTALAISLGAPFWFDLLNKFINLRNTGKKPDQDQNAAASGQQNQKPLPNSFA